MPQKLYLDANVVMPAITRGHPLRSSYSQALRQLTDASARAGTRISVVVGEQFLNEVVSHRNLAIEMVERLNLEEPEDLSRYIALRGALYTNVFVAAFASRERDLGEGRLRAFSGRGPRTTLRGTG